MNAPKSRAKSVAATAGRILIVLAFTSVIGGLAAGPAFAQEHGWYRGEQRRGWQERDRRDDRYRHDTRYRYDRDGRAYRPIYPPPPVVYAPVPSPGVSIFFPLFR